MSLLAYWTVISICSCKQRKIHRSIIRRVPVIREPLIRCINCSHGQQLIRSILSTRERTVHSQLIGACRQSLTRHSDCTPRSVADKCHLLYLCVTPCISVSCTFSVIDSRLWSARPKLLRPDDDALLFLNNY